MTSPDVVFNPLLPEFHANPYPFYRRLREADPVHLSTFGTWILTRYDDAVMVLRDPRFGRETMGDLMEARFGGTEERPAYSRSMRVEGQIAIGTLLRRLPRMELASAAPEWRESSTLRGLKILPVSL